MTTKIYHNNTRRLVSIPCNSGEYRHIPAGARLEIDEIEVKGNAMVEKLLKRGVLLVPKAPKTASADKPSASSAKAGKAKDRASKASD